MFYTFSDYPEVKERFCPLGCFFTSVLVPTDIDPVKDLDNFGNDIDKKVYCFDTEHTTVHNWPNEKEIEVDESDEMFLMVSVLCKEIKD
jgi:hypothetical protein